MKITTYCMVETRDDFVSVTTFEHSERGLDEAMDAFRAKAVVNEIEEDIEFDPGCREAIAAVNDEKGWDLVLLVSS